MLDNKDLEMIAELLAKSEQRINKNIDAKIDASEQRINKNIDDKIDASESMLLKELDRVHGKLQEKVEAVQKNMDELNQYYRITRLENDCTQIVLQKIEQIDKRLEALEKRSA